MVELTTLKGEVFGFNQIPWFSHASLIAFTNGWQWLKKYLYPLQR